MTEERVGEGLPATDPAWDEAFVRVESYLRAHHIDSRVLLNRLAAEIIGEARQLAASHPGDDPVTVAIEVLHRRMSGWFANVLQLGDEADAQLRARGRLALIMAEVPRRWPQHFLSKDPAPQELRQAASESSLHPGPELRLTNMAPAPLEFTFGEAVNDKWKTFSRWPFFRAAAAWLLIAGLLGAAWAASH